MGYYGVMAKEFWMPIIYGNETVGSVAKPDPQKRTSLFDALNKGARFFDRGGNEWRYYAVCDEGAFFVLVDGRVEKRLVSDDNPYSASHGRQGWVQDDTTKPRFFGWGDFGLNLFAVQSAVEDLDIPCVVEPGKPSELPPKPTRPVHVPQSKTKRKSQAHSTTHTDKG